MTDALKARGMREHEILERLYKRGALPALIEAIGISSQCKIPLPKWATKGIVTVLDEVIKNDLEGRKGRHANWLKQYHQDMIDYERHNEVMTLRKLGVKWKDIWETTSQRLEGTDAGGKASTMEKAYKRFKKREKKEPWRYHVWSYYRPPNPGGRKYTNEQAQLVHDVLKRG